MKYKVMLFDNGSGGGSPDTGVGFTFYTISQAVACAVGWGNESGTTYAFLWDGETWRFYN